MKKAVVCFILIWTCILIHCNKQPAFDETSIRKDILAVMDAQVKGWNAAEVEGYMGGYVKSDSVRFVSGGTANYGWHRIMERFKKRYPDPEAMGTLSFTDISVTVLSDDAAVVFGRYTQERKNDRLTGLFTLLFRRTDNGWRIVHDHTSTEP